MFRNPDLSDFTMRIYTSLDEHGLNRRSLKARPKRNLAQGRASTTSGTLGTGPPTYPAPWTEGRRPKGKATGQHVAGRRERQSGSREHWRFHTEIHFKRFLLPLQGADHPDTSYPGCHSLRSFCPGLGSFWAFSPYKARRFLSVQISIIRIHFCPRGHVLGIRINLI